MQLLNGLKDWNNVVLSIFSLHRYDSMTLSPCQVVDLELAESQFVQLRLKNFASV